MNDQKELSDRIEEATRNYIRTVNALIRRDQAKELSSEEAVKELQIAVSRWAYEAQISTPLRRFRDRSLVPRTGVLADLPSRPSRLAGIRVIQTSTADPAKALKLSSQSRNFPNGQTYREYRTTPDRLELAPGYEEYLRNSVEVRFVPVGSVGHIQLRLGDATYDFNAPHSTRYRTDTSSNKAASTGLVFYVPESRISEHAEEIRRIYDNSRNFNIPPFELNSDRLPVEVSSEGAKLVRKSGKVTDEANRANARLVEVDGQTHFETPWGYRHPAVRIQGSQTFCIDGLSCSSSAAYVLKKFFGIDIGSGWSARELDRMKESGNPYGRSPDAVIHYQRASDPEL